MDLLALEKRNHSKKISIQIWSVPRAELICHKEYYTYSYLYHEIIINLVFI